ncbi:MAG: hypothetical protein ACYCXW_05720 [Solirubrobacteraceae bacterium]
MATWVGTAFARTTWLYVEFDGGGVGTAQNATGSGGTVQLNASWTLLYKLPVTVAGRKIGLACLESSCGGEPYPYAASGSGTASLAGSGNVYENCTGNVSMNPHFYGTANLLRYTAGRDWLSVSTYSPMEAGLNLGYSGGQCAIAGGDFAEGSGTAKSRHYDFSELVGHPGVAYSTEVHGSSSEPAAGTVLTPQQVKWAGYLRVKLGGCEPTLSNLKRCFPLPRRR